MNSPTLSTPIIRHLVLTLGAALSCASAHGAHIVTQTTLDGVPVEKTDTYANAAGDLRMEARRYGSSATMSAAGGEATVTYFERDVDEITLFQSRTATIVSLEGENCMKLSADSEAPMGLGNGLGDALGGGAKMAEMMQQANNAIAEAMQEAERQGMTAEQKRAIESFTKPFLEAPAAAPDDTLSARALNETTDVGGYRATGYLVTDRTGTHTHRIWVAPVKRIPGGSDVRRAMLGMIDAYSSYLGKFGGEKLMDTELTGLLAKAPFEQSYPVRIEDLSTRHVTDLIEASAGGGDVDYYPACKAMGLFGP